MFAFAGPQEVRELELGTDMASVNNLLGFLEKARIPSPAQPGQSGPAHCRLCSSQPALHACMAPGRAPPEPCAMLVEIRSQWAADSCMRLKQRPPSPKG